MLDRNLKALFTAILGLMALVYVIQNWLNLQRAYDTFAYVLGLQDHEAYPANLLPPVEGTLMMAAAWTTFIAEFATGVVLLYGAWKLWQARGANAADYARATAPARLGAGLAVITWFGLFGLFGGAGYQMWQTDIGSGSLNDAFKFSVWGFLLLIWLTQGEREVG